VVAEAAPNATSVERSAISLASAPQTVVVVHTVVEPSVVPTVVVVVVVPVVVSRLATLAVATVSSLALDNQLALTD